MSSRLSDCLLRDGTLSAPVVRAAIARQTVYGGALDTALLELGAVDEPTLWAALATAAGVPVPEATLFENPDAQAAALFDATWSRRCRAVPVGGGDGTVQLICSDPIDQAALQAARAALGLSFDIYVVPEVRLAAARQAVYGETMPPRLVRLLARLLGAQPVRRWVESQAPRRGPEAPRSEPAADPAAPMLAPNEFDVSLPSFSRPATTPVGRAPTMFGGDDDPAATARGRAAHALGDDAALEQLCVTAQDPTAEARLPALRVLRTRLPHPRVRALADKLREDLGGSTEVAVLAASALTELRDPLAVPALIAALNGAPALAQTARQALVEIAKQDHGQSRRRWTAWWDRHQGEDRIDWLFDGLSHKAPEIRFSASEELRVITGEYFGYHFDLPKREREDARTRWQAWWSEKRAGG